MKERYQEIVRYLIVGVLTTIVSLSVYYGCVLTILDPEQAFQLQVANVVSWIAAVTFAYIANRIFVFRSKSRDWFQEARAFVCARVATLLMDMAIMFALVTICHYNDKIAKLVVQVVVTAANYILSRVLVFRNR